MLIFDRHQKHIWIAPITQTLQKRHFLIGHNTKGIVFCCYNCLDLPWEKFFQVWVDCLPSSWEQENSVEKMLRKFEALLSVYFCNSNMFCTKNCRFFQILSRTSPFELNGQKTMLNSSIYSWHGSFIPDGQEKRTTGSENIMDTSFSILMLTRYYKLLRFWLKLTFHWSKIQQTKIAVTKQKECMKVSWKLYYCWK